MVPGTNLAFAVAFELATSVLATAITVALALLYLLRVRLERPPIGTFNGRDIATLFVFIVGLPLLYVAMPLTPLLTVLGLTFASALTFGLRPVLGPGRAWLVIGALMGANIWMARTMLGTVQGWQLFWIENSVIVVLAAVTVSNLYVQGGMRVQHVAWFALALAAYDAVFTFVWPLTNQLAERFLGWPFDPSVGFRWGLYNASFGLGDLLVYCLFTLVVLKAYGWGPAAGAFGLSVVLGALVPAVVPLLTTAFIDARTDLVVPAQTAFGPGAFVFAVWLRHRRGAERTMVQFLATLQPAPTRRELLARPALLSPDPDTP